MKKLLALILALAMVLTLAACGSSSKGNDAGSPGAKTDTGASGDGVKDTIVVGWTRQPEDFDPAFTNNGIGMQLVYEQLFMHNPDTGELEPWLVETYEWLDDTTLHLTLKDGITFSNGDPLTAEDVIWSMKYYLESGSNLATYYNVYDFDNCVIEDNRNFTLKYKQPYGPALAYLTLPKIQNKSYSEEFGADAFWDAPCGSGPYTCTENVEGSHTSYALRDDYWNKNFTPEVKNFVVKSYREATTMYIDFENGALDMAFGLDANDAERAQKDNGNGYTLHIQPSLDVKMLCLNPAKEEFQNDLVRQAIACAVEWDKVGEAAFGVMCSKATSTLPTGCSFKIDLEDYTYDAAKAKQLMEQAGYADGFDVRLVLVNDTYNQRMAEALHAYLAAINIRINIESYEIATAIPMFMAGETDMVIKTAEGGAFCLEPDQIFDTLKASSTLRAAATNSEEFDGYLMNGLFSIDPAVREEMYVKAQQWCHDTCWYIPICEDSVAYVCAEGVSLNTVNVHFPYLIFTHLG
jgi:peptide/nickel transport system substrate-binding protein